MLAKTYNKKKSDLVKIFFNKIFIFLIISFLIDANEKSFATISKYEENANVETIIQVKVKSVVEDNKIFLKDISDIKADGYLREKIDGIMVGVSPVPGIEKIISGKRIASIIRSKKWIPQDSKIIIPENVWIKRASQYVSEEILKKIFINYISKMHKDDKFVVSRFKIRGKTVFPVGNMEFNVIDSRKKKSAGLVNLTVVISINGNESGRIFISGWLEREIKAVCAKHFIPKNAILTEDDLILSKVNISKVVPNIITSLEYAKGKFVKRRVKPGDFLRKNMLKMPNVINKGDKIKLVAKAGLITVTALGIAKGFGSVGEQIQVKNVDSKKIIVGRIKDQMTVEVFY